MEYKEFATVSWDYEDVQFVSDDDDITVEEAEKFLKENEQTLVKLLCRVGVDLLEQMWVDYRSKQDIN